MIISASRRTDIPNYYSEWFVNRIKQGFVQVRNPMNAKQVSQVSLSPEVVDAIVFWTKNPSPMLGMLPFLRDFSYYFQFTITPYGRDVEPAIPDKNKVIIPVFQQLSDMIGSDKVIWRFDPILISEKYSIDYHVHAFEKIAKRLHGYTSKCIISFVDEYRFIRKGLQSIEARIVLPESVYELAGSLAEIAMTEGIALETCAEDIDLTNYGINHASCIDAHLIEEVFGKKLHFRKDKKQRVACGCAESIDIGSYNTCGNGCLYCYANRSAKTVIQNRASHNPESTMLSGSLSSTGSGSAPHI